MIQDSFEAPFINDVHYAFDKEFLITSGNGLYTASTIGNCNTRKYHALLAASNQYNDDVNVLVANIDESVNCNAKTYHLATHKYPCLYHPQGYR
ncbi:MAG: glycogen debranching enzyme N-terminal domain-containing protein, partial [Bacteroidetes bacterium]|nr:glycogen debranching enzyme N-terminal domain-containing protein [Bacteroidota bacterium]